MGDSPAPDVSSNSTDKPLTDTVDGIGIGEEDADFYYPMNNRRRGLALVLNYEKFHPGHREKGLSERQGSGVDAKKLVETFGALGFAVQRHDNLKTADTNNLFRDIANNEALAESDAFVVAVMSHGDMDEEGRGKFFTFDSSLLIDKDLVSRFSGSRCPYLIGKPKLFFLQACQGTKFDSGVKVVTDGPSVQNESRDSVGSRVISLPEEADILVSYSTPPGYYSWRNESRGSWYIQELCSGLNTWGFRLDLTELLGRVCRKVAVGYESNSTDQRFNAKKQCPSYVCRLTRQLRFLPKQ